MVVHPLVERATSDLLIGPDWARNAEISDLLLSNPGLTKDVIKGIRKKLGSKNAKVQLLALTLLESIMNSCGNLTHMLVAEKKVLRKMVKIAKKKRNYHVREKILVLIETWQEAFGGPGCRYPEYYEAYYELLHAGAAFPRHHDRRTPVFSVNPAQNLAYGPNPLCLTNTKEGVEGSDDTEFPMLSLSELQNARGIVDVLAEMLDGLEPGNEEGLQQDAIVDLVQQCRTYKQRVVHLINSTTDESLLQQGLALNDDLQRLLAKHEAIASGTSLEGKNSNSQALIDIDDIGTSDANKQPDGASTSGTNPANSLDLILLDPATKDGSVASGLDLLSGDNDNNQEGQDSLALVPVGDTNSLDTSDQNATVLSEILPQEGSSFDPQSLQPEEHAHASYLTHNPDDPQAAVYCNGYPRNIGLSQDHQQEDPNVYGSEGSGVLPRPPWELEQEENDGTLSQYQQSDMQMTQGMVAYPQHHDNMQPHLYGANPGMAMYLQPMPNGQMGMVYYQPIQPKQPRVKTPEGFIGNPKLMQAAAAASMYAKSMTENQLQNYGYAPQYQPQAMYGMQGMDQNSFANASYQMQPSATSAPMRRPSNGAEDKLFGDLVNMARVKPKTSSSTGESGGAS